MIRFIKVISAVGAVAAACIPGVSSAYCNDFDQHPVEARRERIELRRERDLRLRHLRDEARDHGRFNRHGRFERER